MIPSGCDRTLVRPGMESAHGWWAIDAVALRGGEIAAAPDVVMWLPFKGDDTDSAGVILCGDKSRPELGLSARGEAGLEALMPGGLGAGRMPSVVRMTGSPDCCGVHLGVLYEAPDDGALALAPLHLSHGGLAFPEIRESYRPRLGPGVESGKFVFHPLRASGLMVAQRRPREVDSMIQWVDELARPRGWERIEELDLGTPRYAVAGANLLVIGLSDGVPERTVGFARLRDAERVAQVAAVEVFDEEVRGF